MNYVPPSPRPLRARALHQNNSRRPPGQTSLAAELGEARAELAAMRASAAAAQEAAAAALGDGSDAAAVGAALAAKEAEAADLKYKLEQVRRATWVGPRGAR